MNRLGGAQVGEIAAFLVFLMVRGLLLWLVIPAGVALWLLLVPARVLLRKRYLRLGQVIGWLDLNSSALIGQLTLRPIGRSARFTPWSEIERVTHRVRLADPW
jgi:hypothetical protein